MPRVTAVATTFSPEVAAPSRERSQVRDLDATVAELLDELEGTDIAG
jgi:hypothetical protein